jgi:hypothetical protein
MQVQAPLKKQLWLLVSFALIAFVTLTNRWLDIPIHGDSSRYSTLASFAPGFPDHPVFNNTYTARFTMPWLVGTVAHLTQLETHTVFLIAVLAALFGISATLFLIANQWNVPKNFALFGLSIAILNPYVSRHYLLWPELVHELYFSWSVLLLSYFMIESKKFRVLLILGVAALFRQTAVVLGPVIALSFLWQAPRTGSRILLAFFVCLTPVAVGVGLSKFSASFTDLQVNDILWKGSSLGLPYWFQDWWNGNRLGLERYILETNGFFGAQNFDHFNQGNAFPSPTPQLFELFEIFLRSLIPLSVPVFLIFSLLRKTILSKDSILLLLLALAICTQPMMLGPYGGGAHNAKYCSYAFFPLLLVLFRNFPKLYPLFQFKSSHLKACVALLILGSMHHSYSVLGGDPSHSKVFAAAYFGIGALLSLSLFLLVRNYSAHSLPRTRT